MLERESWLPSAVRSPLPPLDSILPERRTRLQRAQQRVVQMQAALPPETLDIERDGVAYHEAGHAAAAVAEGGYVRCAAMYREAGRWSGHVNFDHPDPYACIAVCFAGPLAKSTFLYGEWVEPFGRWSQHDWEVAAGHSSNPLFPWSDPKFVAAWRSTHRFVAARWTVIERVANLLLARGTLRHEDIYPLTQE